MKSLVDRMGQAGIVLKELDRQSMRRTELEQCIIRKGGTHATFEGIFHFLVANGYVAKEEAKHTAAYIITEKGSKLLDALR